MYYLVVLILLIFVFNCTDKDAVAADRSHDRSITQSNVYDLLEPDIEMVASDKFRLWLPGIYIGNCVSICLCVSN